MRVPRLAIAAIALTAAVRAPAQEREDRTLLPQAQMTAIINEVSGERAMHTLLASCPTSGCGRRRSTSGHSARAR